MIFYDPKVMRKPIGGDENQENLGKSLGGGSIAAILYKVTLVPPPP